MSFNTIQNDIKKQQYIADNQHALQIATYIQSPQNQQNQNQNQHRRPPQLKRIRYLSDDQLLPLTPKIIRGKF